MLSVADAQGDLNWTLGKDGITLFEDNITSNNNQNYLYRSCVAADSCYQLLLSSPTAWSGKLLIKDFYGRIITETPNIEITAAEPFSSIEICTPQRLANDIGIYELVAPISSSDLTNNEQVKVKIRNFGTQTISDFTVNYQFNNENLVSKSFGDSIRPGEIKLVVFDEVIDLSQFGVDFYLKTFTNLNSILDENVTNDTLNATINRIARYDIAILDLKSNFGCDTIFFPYVEVKLKNEGINDIDFCQFNYSVVGSTDTLAAFIPVTLLPGDSVFVSVPIEIYQNNTSLPIEFWAVQLNFNQKDANISNSVKMFNIESKDDYLPIILDISLDDFPELFNWEIRDENDVVLDFGDNYIIPEQTFNRNICLPKNQCYKFNAWTDNGAAFDGSITVSSLFGFHVYNKKIVANDTLSANCCLYNPCANFTISVETVKSSTTTSNDGQIIVHTQNGKAPINFTIAGTSNLQPDSIFNNVAYGNYNVYVRDGNFCIKTKSVFLDAITGSTPLETTQTELLVNPNPTKSIVTVTLKGDDLPQYVDCQILDISGQYLFSDRLVKWDNTLRGIFTVENLQSGTYLIKVKLKSGQELVEQLIKIN